MSAVYVGRHAVTQRDVAVKVLDPAMFVDPAARARFVREVTAPVRIGHPGIVEILDAGADANLGVQYVVMELLAGHDMRQELSVGAVPLGRALTLIRGLLDPLAAAHLANVVHRDLKPENVFVCTQGDGGVRMKILDFGIARDLSAVSATATATAIGTPHYMSPEQMHSARSVTPAADVWSVGVILHELLSGAPPFDGETVPAVFIAVATKEAPALSDLVPAQVRAAVTACLQKDPRSRPQNAAALLAMLNEPTKANVALGLAQTRPLIAPTLPMPQAPNPAPPVTTPRTVEMSRANSDVTYPPEDAPRAPRLTATTAIVGFALLAAVGLAGASILSPRATRPPPPPPLVAPTAPESSVAPAVPGPVPQAEEQTGGRLPTTTGTPVPTAAAEQSPDPSDSAASAASRAPHRSTAAPPVARALDEACRADDDCATGLVCAGNHRCARSVDDLLASAAAPTRGTDAHDDPSATRALATLEGRDEEHLQATPSRAEVLRAMESVQSSVEQCIFRDHGTASVRASVSGSTGHVTNVALSGVFAGTPIGSCIVTAVRQAVFPHFHNTTFTFDYSYRM